MPGQSTVETVNALVEALNRGDVDAAVAQYEPGATLVVEPGKLATGTLALREALAGLAALKPVITTEAYQVIEAGDVALYCSRWRMRGTDPAGNPVQMGGRSSDVFRRQPDGKWLIVLDNPFGPDIVP
jgi:ketosteroid isomerase-like protein